MTQAQLGLQIRAQVSYADARGTVESVASGATAAVATWNNQAPTGTVSLAGAAAQGQVLTASHTLPC